MVLMDRGMVLEPIRAAIDADRCGACKLCIASCPFAAIEFDTERNVSRVIRELCQGCGTCAAGCPAGAAHQENFEDVQIYAELEGALAV
jgi:heterodisulfide reductase subunit A